MTIKHIFTIFVLSLSMATAQNIQVNGGVTLGGQIGTSSQPALPFTITIASEPAGIVNSAYTGATIQTQNGVAPITFSETGNVPGLAFNTSTGVFSGTPTTAGNYAVTITATDSTPVTPQSTSANYTIAITAAATSADNRYCNTNETSSMTQDGPAAPLQTCVRTAMADTPSPGSTVTVVAGSISDLQSKITNAVCGTTIVIPALTSPGVQAIYSGQIQPHATCTGSQWITVETDQLASLPAEGNRISPAWVGIASLPGRPAYAQPSGGAAIYMPKLINNNSVILAQAGMSHWRFIGLELTTTSGATVQPAIFLCSTNCDHVIADRMLIHGGNSPTGQDRDSVQVGFRSDGTYNAVIDSYIFDIHCVANGVCVDNYAIFPGGVSAGANNTFKAVDNFLEAAGEGIITGGGGQGAGNTTTTLTDLEVRRNHLFKPLFWKSNDPSYFGTNFIIKNCFELKNTNRVLFEGNLCDTNWGGQSDQFGTLINLGSKNQANAAFGSANTDASGNVTWVSGTQFNSSLVSPLCATPNHCNIKINGSSYQVQTYISPTQITVSPATTAQTSVSYTEFFPGLNPNAIVSNITIRYSQLSHASRCLAMFTVPSDGGDIALGTNSITIHDIVCDDISTIWNVSTGACCFWASSFQVQNGYASPDNMHDILIHHVTALSFQNFGTYANGNGGPSFGFGFQSSPTGAVPHLQIYDNIGTVGWTGSASICNTGQDSVLNRMKCYDTLNGVAQGTYCFDHNLFATSTQGTISGATNNTPYPAATDSPGCAFTRTGQQFVTSFANIGFTNLNGANGGNYQLLNTSPGHNAASDGTDLGVNWSALQTNIAGVN